MNSTLHHRASIIVFDVAPPARLGQVWVLSEALLAKVLDRIIICICQKVVDLSTLSMVFQLVHEPRTISFDLLGCCDCKEDNLTELLFLKGTKHAATKNL